MNKRGIKIWAMLLVFVLVMGEGNLLYAMPENDICYEAEPISEEIIYEEESLEEDAQEFFEEVSETEEQTYEMTEEETKTDSETVGLELFPGLPEGWKFDALDKEQRVLLSTHADDEEAFMEGFACAAGEILVSAKTQEEAEIYAHAYGGVLKRYVDSVAVISLSSNENVSVRDAVFASLDENNRLPAAWPNSYYYIENSEIKEVAEEKDDEFEAELTSVYDDKYLNPFYTEYQWFHHVIGSERAWKNGYTGDGIKVAVLDSGVMLGHEDLSVKATSVLEGSDAKDILGHGTHVCGLIGATLNNGLGGAGVAPDASVYSIKVTDETIVTADNLIAGMQAARGYGVDIVNISAASPNYNPFVEEKIKELYRSGIAVFAAAGNWGTNAYTYPAAFDGVIAVASIDEALQPAATSNYGKMITYAAPGENILSSVNDEELLYGKKSGTSSASPIVAGSAAVILQYARQNGLIKKESNSYDVDCLLAVLEGGAVKVKGTGMGKGYISLPKALGLSESVDMPALTLPQGSYEAEELTLGFVEIPGTEIYYTVNGKKPLVDGGKVSNADLYSGPFLVSQGSVTVRAIAIDTETRQASKLLTATYALKPKVTGISVAAQGSPVLTPGSSLTLKADVTPAHAANQKLTWDVSPANEGVTVKNGVVKVAKTAPEREYIVRVASCDSSDIKAYFAVYVRKAQKNLITSIKRNVSGTVSVAKSRTTKLEITVSKQDKSQGTANELQWYSQNSKVADVICGEGQIQILGIKEGTTKIVGAAKDGSGKKITIPVTVVIRAESLTADEARELSAGKTITIQTEVLPSNTTNPKLTWTVSPENKGVTVKNGKVTATKKAVQGEYVIEAKTKDGSELTVQTTVRVTSGKIKTFSFKETKKSVFRVRNNYGAQTEAFLYLNISGSGFENWKVTSSDPDILAVVRTGNNEVYVKATGKGCKTVTITAETTDGTDKLTKCKVKVINPASNMWITIPKERSENLAKGKTMQLKVTMEDAYGPLSKESYKYEWSSTRPENISVNKNGVVKALKGSGTTSVYAKTTDGSGMFATKYLYATAAPKEISLSGVSEIKKDERKMYEIGINATGDGDIYYDSVRISIDREGLGCSRTKNSNKFYLIGNVRGSYKVKIYTVDGTKREKTYRIIVE